MSSRRWRMGIVGEGGDAFDVKVLAIDEDPGKLKLSRKAALADVVRSIKNWSGPGGVVNTNNS